MGKYLFKDNILLQYSIISFSLTIILAVILSWLTSDQLKNQLVYSHGDFYRAFIEVIDENYSEVIPSIMGEHESNETAQDSADDHGHGHDVWSHFNTDLLQFPFVKEFRIYDSEGKMLQNQSKNGAGSYFETLQNQGLRVSADDRFYIFDSDDTFVVVYNLPIIFDNRVIGTAQITDIDSALKIKINSIQKRAVLQIVLGGIIFYFGLFILYYRVHRNQAKTIENLDRSQSLTIETMSRLAELRDDNTGAHIRRTSLYCKILAAELSRKKQFSSYLSSAYIRDLERSAPLHDIGKVGVPDSILQKPGPLTDEEFKIIKTHPELGAKVLHRASETLGFQSFFEIGYQIVMHHHENWDGSGYPQGLAEESIPLSARIMAVADVYDALTTNRPYKEAFTHKKTLAVIKEESGKKFDPRIVDALMSVSDEIEAVAREYADSDNKNLPE